MTDQSAVITHHKAGHVVAAPMTRNNELDPRTTIRSAVKDSVVALRVAAVAGVLAEVEAAVLAAESFAHHRV